MNPYPYYENEDAEENSAFECSGRIGDWTQHVLPAGKFRTASGLSHRKVVESKAVRTGGVETKWIKGDTNPITKSNIL